MENQEEKIKDIKINNNLIENNELKKNINEIIKVEEKIEEKKDNINEEKNDLKKIINDNKYINKILITVTKSWFTKKMY